MLHDAARLGGHHDADQIGGVSQQQGSGGSFTLTSQYGTVDVGSLPVISVNGVAPQSFTQNAAPQNSPQQQPSQQWNPPAAGNTQEADIFAKIERLAELQQKGIISQEEFSTKKSELLSRL